MVEILERYRNLSEPELYIELATALAGGHAAAPDREAAERSGYAYFQNSLPTIRRMVCDSLTVMSFINKDDVFALASAIAELISSHFKLPAAAATMAVLSAKMGMKALCPNVTK